MSDMPTPSIPRMLLLSGMREQYEQMVRNALAESGGRIHETARLLGVSERTLFRILEDPAFRDDVRRRVGRPAGFKYRQKPDAKPSYAECHLRVARVRGKPQTCEVCGTSSKRKRYDWANLTGRYDDADDYKRMCRTCHRQFDEQRKRAAKAAGEPVVSGAVAWETRGRKLAG